MTYTNERVYNKKNYNRNGVKSEGQYAKNSMNQSIEQPELNESGVEAKKKGF